MPLGDGCYVVLGRVRKALHTPEGYSVVGQAKEMFRRNWKYCQLHDILTNELNGRIPQWLHDELQRALKSEPPDAL